MFDPVRLETGVAVQRTAIAEWLLMCELSTYAPYVSPLHAFPILSIPAPLGSSKQKVFAMTEAVECGLKHREHGFWVHASRKRCTQDAMHCVIPRMQGFHLSGGARLSIALFLRDYDLMVPSQARGVLMRMFGAANAARTRLAFTEYR